jgi:hypothetical protein
VRAPFTVAEVPDRFPIYSIAVGNEPAKTFSRTQLAKTVTIGAGQLN